MSAQDEAYLDRVARDYAWDAIGVLGVSTEVVSLFGNWYLAECRNEEPRYWPALTMATFERFMGEQS